MNRLSLAYVTCAALILASSAHAQLVLPGATAPTPAGAAPAAAAAGAIRKPARKTGDSAGPDAGPVAVTRAPGEDTVAGRQFQRNGSAGLMAIEKAASGGLELSKLVLVGYQISRPAELCRVEVSGARIALKPAERRQGLISYQADMEACPFSLDVLDGAVRVRGAVCEFKAADCSADPSGVWGPPGASIGEAEAKNIEKLRAAAEKNARAGFRALLARAGRDKALAKSIVSDQAAFSSAREVACRDYAREDKHGFCASRITEARAVALSAQLHGDGAAPDKAEKPKPKRKPRPRPATIAAPALPPPALQ
jgi:hypothetical protein